MKNKYLKQLSHYLSTNRKLKKKIIEELSDEIQRREESGESISDILQSMGTPKEVAHEFNMNLLSNNNSINVKYKILIIVLSTIGSILLILALHNIITIFAPKLSIQYFLSSLSDDGNKASFVIFKLSYKSVIVKILVELILSGIAFCSIAKIKKVLSRKGSEELIDDNTITR